MKVKCTNCRGGSGCGQGAVIYFEFIGDIRELGNRNEFIASCSLAKSNWDRESWKQITEEEYLAYEIMTS